MAQDIRRSGLFTNRPLYRALGAGLRRAALPLCVLFLSLPFPVLAEPKPDPATEQLLKSLAQGSAQQLPLSVQRTLLDLHYRNVANRHAGVLGKLAADAGLKNLDDVRDELRWAEAYYKVARANVEITKVQHQVGKFALDTLELVPVKHPVGALTIRAANKFADPLMAGARAVTNWTVDLGVSRAFSPSDTEARLREFTKIAVLDGAGKVDPTKLKEAAGYLQKDFVDNAAFNALSEQEKAELARAMQARIEMALDEQGVKIGDIFERMKTVEGDAKTAVETIGKTKKLVEQAAKRHQQFADRVQTSHKEINRGLSVLSGQIETNGDLMRTNNRIAATNGYKFDIVMSAMYDQLPTTQKLEWLKSEYFRLPPGVDRGAEAARLEQRRIIEHQVALSQEIDGYLNDGRQVLQIAQNLGLPAGALDAADKAIKVVEAGNGAVRNFVTGNYIGAVAGVVNLLSGGLFGSGPDIGEIRHRQIMEQFGLVNQKLDAMLKAQEQILTVVVGIDQKIVQLGQIVVAQHEQVMRELTEIRHQTAWNTLLLDQVLRRDMDSCKEFLKIRSKPNYGDMETFFNNNTQGYEAGLNLLSVWVGGIDPSAPDGWRTLNKWFFARTHLQPGNDEIIPLLERQLKSLRDRLSLIHPDMPAQRRAWSAGAICCTSIDALDAKITALKAGSVSQIAMPYEVMDEVLSPEAVSEFAQTLVAFTDYLFLVNRQSAPLRLFTTAELDSPGSFEASEMRGRREKARTGLLFCLAVVNAALAQQNLLAGDQLLPQLAEGLETDDVRKDLIENRILAGNALVHALKQRLKANGHSVLAYAVALESQDVSYLQQITKKEGAPAWILTSTTTKELVDGKETEVRRWSAEVSKGLKIPMPPADRVRGGQLDVMPGVATLLSIRENLVSKIAELDMAETLPEDRARRLGLITLSQFN